MNLINFEEEEETEQFQYGPCTIGARVLINLNRTWLLRWFDLFKQTTDYSIFSVTKYYPSALILGCALRKMNPEYFMPQIQV